MIVVSDSNIIFSALITPNGTVASIIKAKRKFKIIAPTYLLDELYEHFDDLLVNTPFNTSVELNKQIKLISEYIEFVDVEIITKKARVTAYQLVKDVDLDDLFFVALAIHKKCTLWTSDIKLINGLKKKGFKNTITTTELKKFLYKK